MPRVLSSLLRGAFEQLLERSLRQILIIAASAALLVAAAAFGLLAAYHSLVFFYQFNAVEAAAAMTACLLLAALIVLASLPIFGRPPKGGSPTPVLATGRGSGRNEAITATPAPPSYPLRANDSGFSYLPSGLVNPAPLTDQHVRNWELLEQLPKGGIAAEIGVDTGRFSELIHETTA